MSKDATRETEYKNVCDHPRIMIAAPGSGSGKTLITCAVLRILDRRGIKVASFKCGPDYIDPMFHKQVLGIPSRNLDMFLSGEDGMIETLKRGTVGSDIAVIEGVMGFFDGMNMESSDNSSYDIARRTGTPVILVVSCKGMGRSIIPFIKGFTDYQYEKCIKGIILNNTSKTVYEILKEDIYKETGAKVLGFLPKLKDLEIGSRHLGLMQPEEIPEILKTIDRVADALLESLDVKVILEIAKEAAKTCNSEGNLNNFASCTNQVNWGNDIDDSKSIYHARHSIRIGIARDEAFSFYYEDNLELLQNLGAELVFFSPMRDKEIPDVSRLILGGGYPELYAKALSENESIKESIRQAISNKMPVLAECGGFLYLNRTLETPEKDSYKMVGIFDGDCHMQDKLTHFGYVNVRATVDTPYLRFGEIVRGHEFHYYDTSDNGDTCEVLKPNGKRKWGGYKVKENVFSGFAHLYYPSNIEFIKRFIER